MKPWSDDVDVVILRRKISFVGVFAFILLALAMFADPDIVSRWAGAETNIAMPRVTDAPTHRHNSSMTQLEHDRMTTVRVQSIETSLKVDLTSPTATSSPKPQFSIVITPRDVAVVHCPKIKAQQVTPDRLAKQILAEGGKLVRVDLNSFHGIGGDCCGIVDCSRATTHKYQPGKFSFPSKWPSSSCPAHTQFVQAHVFAKCSSCKFFFLAWDCVSLQGSAIYANRTQGVIIGASHGISVCGTGRSFSKFDGYRAEADLVNADLTLVDSGRTFIICKKGMHMWLSGPYNHGLDVSSSTLMQRRATMEEKRKKACMDCKPKYVLLLGGNPSRHRDHATVMKAVTGLGIQLLIAAKGNTIAGCARRKSLDCKSLGMISLISLHTYIAKALLIAIPLWGMGTNRGISTLSKAMMFGKIVLITDTGLDLHKGFIFHGVNGFVLPVQDVSAWRQAIKNVKKMNAADFYNFEERAFRAAERWTTENITARLMSHLGTLPRAHKMASSKRGLRNIV